MNQELLRQQIVGSFLSAKGSNQRYSKRAYASKLGISHGALVEIMSGKRNVSIKMAKKLCFQMSLSPKQTDAIICEPKVNSNGEEIEINEDHFFLISDYTYFALINLLKIKSPDHSLQYFAKRLEITEAKAKLVVERLLRLNMIELNPKGFYVRTKTAFKTTDEVLSLSIKAAHRSSLEQSIVKLSDTPIELRDFSTITMAINTKKIPAAKKLLRKFQDDLASLLEDSKPDEVYSFNMQLVPLSTKGDV